MKIPPPLPTDPTSIISHFDAYLELVKILRIQCPGDKEQTHESLAPLLIEEAYETTDAIYQKDPSALKEELGDVFLHVIMHSIIAEEENLFTLADVIKYSTDKMIRRHPHIFDDLSVQNTNEILQNGEEIKKKEGKDSVLSGVPNSLPSLLKAERIQQKAAKVGFDGEKKEDVGDKVFEEIEELRSEILNGTTKDIENEFGDVLFSLVNAARFSNIIPENALQKTCNKFIKRFNHIEQVSLRNGKSLKSMTLSEMDELGNEAKKITNI